MRIFGSKKRFRLKFYQKFIRKIIMRHRKVFLYQLFLNYYMPNIIKLKKIIKKFLLKRDLIQIIVRNVLKLLLMLN